MLAIQKPGTLPEAYTSCLEFQNLNFRNNSIHPRNNKYNTITKPINQMYNPGNHYKPNTPYKNLNTGEQIRIYNAATPYSQDQQYTQNAPPPRPSQPKPPVPMEIDPSMKSHRINYMNRPQKLPLPNSDNNSSNIPRKQQRIFNIETMETYGQDPAQDHDTQYTEFQENGESELEYEQDELNFMTEASLAYHT